MSPGRGFSRLDSQSALFLAASATLAGEQSQSVCGRDVGELLARLEYASTDARRVGHRVALLRAAARLKRIFQLQAPDAPGLIFLGGEADPSVLGSTYDGLPVAGLSGSGLSLRKAFESCVGEGVEYLSQFETAESMLERDSIAARAAALDRHAQRLISKLAQDREEGAVRTLDWIPAVRQSDNGAAWLPADICLRRPNDTRDFSPPFKLGTGCGAGISADDAALHGLLELVERDAASLWWRGGRRGRAIAAEERAWADGADLIAELRRGAEGRTSWLLDITTDVGTPVVAALSSRPDGHGLACGLAARLTKGSAVRSAIFEMCQMELGYSVIEAKRRERGDAALNQDDRRHLRRATEFDARACDLLRPLGTGTAAIEAEEVSATASLRAIVERLATLGIETYRVELTRESFGIPVVRMVAPGLQLEPSGIVTERLASTIAATGGGRSYTGDVPLL
jgi:ribosomal protein S12 methylthiotransferase accessory factor